MKSIFVSGAIANKPFQGGEAWIRLSWALGLKQLGFEVTFVEQIAPRALVDADGQPAPLQESVNKRYFDQVVRQFGLTAGLIDEQSGQSWGLSTQKLFDAAESAALLVNIGGHLTWPPLFERFRLKAYVDIDPGFTQFWHLDPISGFRIAPHDVYFTIGENLGRADCTIPTAGISWKGIRQPVVLEHWPITASACEVRFTTIANWRGPFGPVEYGGKTFGLKVHQFRKVLELPKRAGPHFEMALNIHPNEERDLAALRQNGWSLIDPRRVADTPDNFRTYIQRSGAEFSAAQGIYVDTHSGWFSDRTVRYLASGKPALVEDTGFGRTLPTGEGLGSFRTLDEAVAGAEAIMSDYDTHSRAARRIAEQYFDSDQVLQPMLREMGLEAEISSDTSATEREQLGVGVR